MWKKLLVALLSIVLVVGFLFLFQYLKKEKAEDNEIFQEKTEEISLLNEDELLISISIDSFAAGVSGSLQPNDIVTVFAYTSGDTKSYIPQYLSAIRVVTTTTGNGIAKEQASYKEDGSFSLPVTVTFSVNENQARVLTWLEKNAYIHLALRSRGDQKTAALLLDKCLNERTEDAINGENSIIELEVGKEEYR